MSPFKLTPPTDDPLGGNQVHVYYNFEWYKFIAYAVRQIIPDVVWDSPPADIGDQVDTLVYLLGVDVPTQYPSSVLLLPPAAHVVNGNAITWASVTAEWFAGVWFQNTAAINDELEWKFTMKAGTYTFLTHGRTAANHGLANWRIDGSLFWSTDDYYSAATVENVEHTHSITIVGDGEHTLNLKIPTKNAVSSSYFHQMSFMKIS